MSSLSGRENEDEFASNWGGEWQKQPRKTRPTTSKQQQASVGASGPVTSPEGISKSTSVPVVAGKRTEPSHDTVSVGEKTGGGGEDKSPLATSTPARPHPKSQVCI